MATLDTLSDKAIRAVLKRASSAGKAEKLSDGAGVNPSEARKVDKAAREQAAERQHLAAAGLPACRCRAPSRTRQTSGSST